MKLTYDNDTLAEKRALILYVLDKVSKPINNYSLLKLILSIENMNYFYFQQFLLDLLDSKYIINYIKDDESIYEITKEGKQTLELTKDLIPGIVKFNIDNTFKETYNDIKNSLSISSEYIPQSEKDYSVRCKLTENNKTIFEIETFAGSREIAKSISDNWNKNANKIYPKILDILTKNYNSSKTNKEYKEDKKNKKERTDKSKKDK